MNVVVFVLFGCLLSVNAIPRPTFDFINDAVSGGLGLAAGISGGFGPDVFVKAFVNGFGGSHGAVPTDFLSAFKSGLSKAGPDGSIPIDSFNDAFNKAGGNNVPFPFDIFNKILGGGSKGSQDNSGGFTDIFSKIFSRFGGKIPSGFADHFNDALKAKDQVSPQEFADAFKSAYGACQGLGGNGNGNVGNGVNASQSSIDSSKDNLSLTQHESRDTTLNKSSEKNSGSFSSLGF